MKQLATIVFLSIVGLANAQSNSKEVEIYERYENGELVEQRQSATENGVPIKDFDFEKAKQEMQLKSAELERKLEEMQVRFEQKREEIQRSMDQKMKELEQRSEEMHQKMDQRMKEMEEKSEEKREESEKPEQPVVETTENLKFT